MGQNICPINARRIFLHFRVCPDAHPQEIIGIFSKSDKIFKRIFFNTRQRILAWSCMVRSSPDLLFLN